MKRDVGGRSGKAAAVELKLRGAKGRSGFGKGCGWVGGWAVGVGGRKAPGENIFLVEKQEFATVHAFPADFWKTTGVA